MIPSLFPCKRSHWQIRSHALRLVLQIYWRNEFPQQECLYPTVCMLLGLVQIKPQDSLSTDVLHPQISGIRAGFSEGWSPQMGFLPFFVPFLGSFLVFPHYMTDIGCFVSLNLSYRTPNKMSVALNLLADTLVSLFVCFILSGHSERKVKMNEISFLLI